MARYTFVDHWSIRAPIAAVFEHVADPRTYPQWWPVYRTVDVLPGVPPPHVGSRVRLTVASPLGYRLTLVSEMIAVDPPRQFRTVAQGQLAGTGTWELEQQGETTAVTWTWIVETHHPLLNLLEPIAKPLFAWSHNTVSAKGQRGLRKWLEKPR